jgi:hypothetical protein
VPLHGYLMQLRLGRALLDLPHTEDLTSLALDPDSRVTATSRSHFAGCSDARHRSSAARPTVRQRAGALKLEDSRQPFSRDCFSGDAERA